MKLSLTPLAILLLSCAAEPSSAQVPAFPGAEGPGATSLGGRGGQVIHVTNLNDSGPGSLRDAINANGPRTVVFDVGGTIQLRSPIGIRKGRITIAGQTAPGGGITVRDYPLNISADDVVVRFIRSRLGDKARFVADSMWISRGTRIIVDHVSTSWGTDETLSVSSGGRDAGDITVQWSIIAESLCNSVNPDGRHCYGSLIAGSKGARISFHHNLWANHAARMPRIGNALAPSVDPLGGFFDIRSNVMYNWGGDAAGYGGLPAAIATYNFVDNTYLTGPNTRAPLIFAEGNTDAKAFFGGNTINGTPQSSAQDRVKGATRPGYFQRGPVKLMVNSDSASSSFRKILAYAGDSLFKDSVDERIVADVRNHTGRLIDSQDDVGGWPVLAAGTPWRDNDGDGIPNDWERKHGLNPRDPSDGARVTSDGYTNLEHWLNELAAPGMAR